MSAAKHTPALRYLRVNGTGADFDIVNEHGGRVASTPYEYHAKALTERYNSHDALVAAMKQADVAICEALIEKARRIMREAIKSVSP